jgi:hypothetical protein
VLDNFGDIVLEDFESEGLFVNVIDSIVLVLEVVEFDFVLIHFLDSFVVLFGGVVEDCESSCNS